MSSKSKIPEIKNFTVYYGYPSLVNNVQGNLKAAAEAFSQYDYIILGANLELSTHDDHNNTTEIIKNLGEKTKVFGYVNLAMTVLKLSMAEMKDRVKNWKKMGAFGIFLDSSGYDYGVTRERQTEIIDFIHKQDLTAFINAFDPADIFSSDTVPVNAHGGGNPKGLKSPLEKKDFYLHESFQIQESKYVDPAFWAAKCQKAIKLSESMEINHMVTTVSSPSANFSQEHLDYAWWSALLWGFQGFCWGEVSFGSTNNQIPFRQRPKVEISGNFTGNVETNGSIFTRHTDKGFVMIDADNHFGSMSDSKK
jgi:hypothetical protein